MLRLKDVDLLPTGGTRQGLKPPAAGPMEDEVDYRLLIQVRVHLSRKLRNSIKALGILRSSAYINGVDLSLLYFHRGFYCGLYNTAHLKTEEDRTITQSNQLFM